MELTETSQLKRNFVSPIGTMLLKTGEVSFEVLEMMFHEQIRQEVREFKTWEKISLSFHEKDIKLSGGIRLMIHEFLTAKTFKNTFYSFSLGSTSHGQSSVPAPSPTMS
jgi:glutaredoxin-related protein